MSGQTRSASSQFSSRFLLRVAAHERVHVRHAHLLARLDDELDVGDRRVAIARVRVERVGVEAEAADGQALRLDLADDVLRLAVATGWPRRCGWCRRSAARTPPICGQHAISSESNSLRRRPVRHFHQRRLRERRGQKPESQRCSLQCWCCAGASTSTQRPCCELCAIASPTSISSCPSANVAYGGLSLMRPRPRRL